METAGLLAKPKQIQLPAAVAAMRPSLAKVQAALRERPDRFAIVKPSPLAILFDFTLPRLETTLAELGEERAEAIVSLLCNHAQRMIAVHKPDGAKDHLESLFRDLPEYAEKIKEPGGVEQIVKVYFAGMEEEFLRARLGDKIRNLIVDEDGMLFLSLMEITVDKDLLCLRPVTNLTKLNINFSNVTDAGLVHIAGLTSLQALGLLATEVTDAGLVHIAKLSALQKLFLGGTKVTDAGLVHLVELISLQELDLGNTLVTDDGLVHIAKLTGLQRLNLDKSRVTDAGIRMLEQAIPGLARTGDFKILRACVITPYSGVKY